MEKVRNKDYHNMFSNKNKFKPKRRMFLKLKGQYFFQIGTSLRKTGTKQYFCT